MTTTEPLNPKSLTRLRAAMDDPRPRISQPVTSYPYPRTVSARSIRRATVLSPAPPCRPPVDWPACHQEPGNWNPL